MDFSCHECGEAQSVWMVARCSNPNKTVACGEAFCFKCLGQTYPQIYHSIFKGLWWLCPVCTGLCKCETCSDPVKKAEYNKQSKRRMKQRQKPVPVEETKPVIKLRSGNKRINVQETPQPALDDLDNWICSRCSIVNSLDDIECIACGCHRKRNTRKRTSQEPVHEADKFHTFKETRKATEINEDKVTPVKGRVSAIRELVKKPWLDGWEQARTLALDLVEEARLLADRQGISLSESRQLPTKYNLANVKAAHSRKWFDREPTLAKKFLQAANFVYTKSSGTFLSDHIKSMEDLPVLIKEADVSKFSEEGGSDDEEGVPTSPSSIDLSTPPLPFHNLQVYFHPSLDSPSSSSLPVQFNLQLTDLSTIDDLHSRINSLLGEHYLPDKKLILKGDCENSIISLEGSNLGDISRCSSLHVYAV